MTPHHTAASPVSHACHTQHAHRCRHCGNTAPCCAPECITLPVGYCVGNCRQITLRQIQALGRGERNALTGPARPTEPAA